MTTKRGPRGPKGETGAPLPKDVRLSFWAIVGVAGVVLLVLGYFINQTRQLAQQGEEAHQVLCIDRTADGRRMIQTADFLQKHPHDKFILDIPRAQIEKQLRDLIADVTAKAFLDCPQPIPKLPKVKEAP